MARVFPPGDPVGNFVLALAAGMNELLMTLKLLYPPDDPDRQDFNAGQQSTLLRLGLAQAWETQRLVREASKVPKVNAFIDQLATKYPGEKLDGRDLVNLLRGRGGVGESQMRGVLHAARNATFHYPKPGDSHLDEVLRGAVDEDRIGEYVAGDTMPTVRATFADDVLLRMALRGVRSFDEEGIGGLFKAFVDTAVAIIHLGQTALGIWISEKGGDDVQQIEEE
jgi:hypothetical protein